MKFPIKYRNGNVLVRIYQDGTKFRYYEGDPKPEFPESIDLKITNQCNAECEFCHENSGPHGRHANLLTTFEKIKCLPKGIEISVGGGDISLHSYMPQFLEALNGAGYIVSSTVRHNYPMRPYAKNLITGMIGVSGMPVSDLPREEDNRVIYHIIAGITDIEDLQYYKKVLVLGFKHFGRAKKMDMSIVNANLDIWRKNIHYYLGTRHIMFDNLAIEQLNIRRFYSDEGWKKMYMGNDGQFSIYVDAVRGEFARNSTTPKNQRISWNKIDILKFFKGLNQ